MLKITVNIAEKWDEINECFIAEKEKALQLEHSLISVSRWESKWGKPFFSTDKMTTEEAIDYVKCMTLTTGVEPEVYENLSHENMKQIEEYNNAPMTATWFTQTGSGKPGREQITSEIIYYLMIAYAIPFECQKWHLNRLLTLIKVCKIKNEPAKKMGKRDTMSRNAAMNAARRKQMNSKG